MRRMFSENQIKSLVNEGIESGEIGVGTKLYKHSITFSNADEMTLITNDPNEYTTRVEIFDGWLKCVGARYYNDDEVEVGTIQSINNSGDSVDFFSHADFEITSRTLEELTFSDSVSPL